RRHISLKSTKQHSARSSSFDLMSCCRRQWISRELSRDRVLYHWASCFSGRPRPTKCRFIFGDMFVITNETRFTVNELEVLYELFKKLSSSIINDRSIHKEEFQLALFGTPYGENLFMDKGYFVLPLRLYVVKLWTTGGFCKRYRMSCWAVLVFFYKFLYEMVLTMYFYKMVLTMYF
ncbi:unnamed protein product, partial [Prunus brigantina]